MAAPRRTPAFVALVLCLFAVRAGAEESDDLMVSVRADGVRRLETLARWCRESRVEGARHRTMRAILSIDPDHAEGRGLLKFYRAKKDGPWIQLDGYREPLDWNKDSLAEYARRFEEAVKSYRNDVLVVLERAGDGAASRFSSVLDGLVSLLPNDELVRKARGDVKLGWTWVMPETARAVARRKEIARFAREALSAVAKPSPAKAESEGYAVALRTRHALILGSVEVAEAERVARYAEACGPFLRRVLGGEGEVLPPARIYLLTSEEEGQALITRKLGEAEWKRCVEGGVVGNWVPEEDAYVTWHGGSPGRERGAVRSLMDSMLRDAVGGSKRGWVLEGLGRALCKQFAGFYGPSIVSFTETDLGQGQGQDIPEESKNWFALARKTLERLEPYRLPLLMTKQRNAMEGADVLLGMALGCYLVEGNPDRALTFITATEEADDAESAVKRGLGVGLVDLRAGLSRWLREMADR